MQPKGSIIECNEDVTSTIDRPELLPLGCWHYLPQVLLTIFKLVTRRSPDSCLRDASSSSFSPPLIRGL